MRARPRGRRAALGSRGIGAAEEARHLVERPLRGREPDALERRVHERFQPLEREREVRAALGRHERVDLVDDDRVEPTAATSRACDVSSRKSDSGVVIRMSAGSRWNRARSRAGVSPVRTATAGTTNGSPRAARQVGDAGDGRAEVALDVDGERLQRRDVEHAAALARVGGTGANMSRSMAHRNAASVLPLPVGAKSSVEAPRAIGGQPRACAAVGASNDAVNQSRTAGMERRERDRRCARGRHGVDLPAHLGGRVQREVAGTTPEQPHAEPV